MGNSGLWFEDGRVSIICPWKIDATSTGRPSFIATAHNKIHFLWSMSSEACFSIVWSLAWNLLIFVLHWFHLLSNLSLHSDCTCLVSPISPQAWRPALVDMQQLFTKHPLNWEKNNWNKQHNQACVVWGRLRHQCLSHLPVKSPSHFGEDSFTRMTLISNLQHPFLLLHTR